MTKKSKSPAKLTAWEAGQELIRAHDECCERAVEMKDFPELQAVCHKAGMEIGFAFNRLKSHAFGLQDWRSCKCGVCEKIEAEHEG